MPRNIPVGNGDMLVAFDDLYRIRDLYWPHVGQPNHTCGHLQRFGVWADGQFAWMDSPGWSRSFSYKHNTLLTEVRLRNDRLGLELVCHDAVDYWSPVYFRQVIVTDLWNRARDVRVFFHADLSVNESPVGDTVAFDPQTGGLIHYKNDFYFLFNGSHPDGVGVTTYATGAKRIGEAEGTWRDAEDGILSRNCIAQGSVDSAVGFQLSLSPNGSQTCVYWIAAGKSYDEVHGLNKKVCDKTPQRMLDRTEAYWRLWSRQEFPSDDPLPKHLQQLHTRSLLIARTQIDNGGAIIAANDYDITHFAGDTYSYMWPRDGALVAQSLVLAGQSELSRNFFRFCERVRHPDGYFHHKYNPNGTVASSWHPWLTEKPSLLPIQQDETALVPWALRQHFVKFRDVEFIKSLYNPLIVDTANWMISYRDHHGLPLPSWDLWEERRGAHLFTVCATIGGLLAASQFAQDMGAHDRASDFSEAAERMRAAMLKHMWDPDRRLFARMANAAEDGSYRLDFTLDASAYALFAFGVLPANDPRVCDHMQAIRERLWVRTDIGGIARYERDRYQQVEHRALENVPGNPWVICTLWLAQWLIAKATTIAELDQAIPYLEWTNWRASSSGVLAEQYHPYTGEQISVSPLTWSHATLITTAMQYRVRHAELSLDPSNNQSSSNPSASNQGASASTEARAG